MSTEECPSSLHGGRFTAGIDWAPGAQPINKEHSKNFGEDNKGIVRLMAGSDTDAQEVGNATKLLLLCLGKN